MNLFKRFEIYLTDEFHLHSPVRILIAVSGGIDSMVLLHLLRQTKHQIAVAHCNFGLRGEESNTDHRFVKDYCILHTIQFFDKEFEVDNYIIENKTGIQEAARTLRYEWFDELSVNHRFDFIATAHHLNDVTETLIFNISRGTGIAGLHGIPAMNRKIIRPLLFATKSEIIEYAEENYISFRSDSSNKKNKYSRNKIRNQVIPVLKEINPLLEEHVLLLTKQMTFIEKIYRDHIQKTWKKIHREKDDGIAILIADLFQLTSLQFYLFEFLHPFGFNYTQVSEIIQSLDKQSGKRFYSPTHLLLKDRETLIIRTLSDKTDIEIDIGEEKKFIAFDKLMLKIEHIHSTDKREFTSDSFYFDMDKLSFPLKLRSWRDGDKFVPLGMNKPKKVSDFFIDEKVNAIEKHQAWILCSGDSTIICILPYRIDDRYKLTSLTKNILKITSINK